MLALGGMITWWSHSSADPGESYVVMTGLFVAGGLTLGVGILSAIVGSWRTRRYRRYLKRRPISVSDLNKPRRWWERW